MLERFLLSSTCSLALTAAVAAADISEAPPPIPLFTWGGFYLGGQIGYAWGHDNGQLGNFGPLGPVTVPVAVASSSTNPNGVLGGAHIGYNWQINQWVLGLEGDVDGADLRQGIQPLPYASATTNLFLQGAILGRVGYSFDHILVYATGGGAFGAIHNTYDVTGFPASYRTTRSGWTVGGGVEYAINDNWLVRAEYRHTDYGFFYDSPIIYFLNDTHHWTTNQVQAGLSYKFGSPATAPVVAKY